MQIYPARPGLTYCILFLHIREIDTGWEPVSFHPAFRHLLLLLLFCQVTKNVSDEYAASIGARSWKTREAPPGNFEWTYEVKQTENPFQNAFHDFQESA